MAWKSTWNSATPYAVGDEVFYGGGSYICIALNTNQAPTNTLYWNVRAAQGATGATGPTGPSGSGGGVISAAATTSGSGFTVLSPNSPLSVPLGTAAAFDAVVIGRLSTTLAATVWRASLIARNDSTSGFQVVVKEDRAMPSPPAGWDVRIAANTGTAQLDVSVQGATNQTVQWKATMTLVEV